MSRLAWSAILSAGDGLVTESETPMTLRQLFYQLVSAELLPNTAAAYKQLSSRTAVARREGEFPPLIDRTRAIHRAGTFEGIEDAREYLYRAYRRERTEGQPYTICLGVEKAGIVEQLRLWFGDLGVPIVCLGGYSSQSYVDEVAEFVDDQGRKSIFIYAGDFDPSGEDIQRDFIERTNCFDEVIRAALTPDQVIEYELPPQMGKLADSRASAFMKRHGRLVQVEVDALPPATLRALYAAELERFWDQSTYEDVVRVEAEEREGLFARD